MLVVLWAALKLADLALLVMIVALAAAGSWTLFLASLPLIMLAIAATWHHGKHGRRAGERQQRL